MNRRTTCILAIALAIANMSYASATQGPRFSPARKVGVVSTPLITEASGLVASRLNVGVLWVHNDSGDSARIYALNTEGKLLGICTVTGAQSRDWEDIAAGPGPKAGQSYLYIGDIGDNDAKYPSVRIYRVPEPNVDPAKPFGNQATATAETIELLYPDGPRDAETLLVDPQTKDIYIVAKRELFCKVYMAAYPQSTIRPTALARVATLPWPLADGGDVSPDGRYVIVRSYNLASLWTRTPGEPLWKAFGKPRVDVPLASEPQGESISFDAAGKGYFTLSEKANQPIYYFEPTTDETGVKLSDAPPAAADSNAKP
jgi:hypothetical protein